MQQLVWKCSQKSKKNLILHYISLPIYPLPFTKFYPIRKQKKETLRNCRYLVKTTLVVYLFFHKLLFFETLIIFLESTIKLIIGIFDLQNNNNSYHDSTSAFLRCYSEKDLHLVAVQCNVSCSSPNKK